MQNVFKYLNFKNTRWRTAAIKKVRLPYLSNRSTDFDEIWHGDAYLCPLTYYRPLKFRIFENPRWRRLPCWKSQKSRYFRNGLTDLQEISRDDAKWVS